MSGEGFFVLVVDIFCMGHLAPFLLCPHPYGH